MGRKFNKEFKLNAIELSEQPGVTVQSVAKDLGLNPKMLYRWRSEHRKESSDAFPGKGKQTPEKAAQREMEKEIKRLRMERDILKKALGVFLRDK